MPSNFTQNYKLSQWSADDRVLHTDFNADNAKIDAALGTLSSQAAQKAEQSALNALQSTVSRIDSQVGLRLIKSGTLPTVTETYQLSVADITWTNWKAVHLLIWSPMTSPFGFGTSNSFSHVQLSKDWSHLIFYPFFRGDFAVSALLLGSAENISDDSKASCNMGSTYNNLTSFWFRRIQYTIQTGVAYQFWGEK